MTSINGATVLVTGGQRGLGRAFVDELLARGAAKVYATARTPDPQQRPPGRAAAARRHRPGVGRRVGPPGTGRLDRDQQRRYHRQRSAPGGVPSTDVRTVFETNVFGALRIAQEFAPILAANGGSALVNIHSALSLDRRSRRVRCLQGGVLVDHELAAAGAGRRRVRRSSASTSATPTPTW